MARGRREASARWELSFKTKSTRPLVMSIDQPASQSAEPAQGPAPKRQMPLLRAFLYVLLVSLLMFLLHDLLVNRWLVHADRRLLQLESLIGHVLFAVVVAAVAGWLIVKNARAFPALSETKVEWSDNLRLADAKWPGIFAEWFVAMRWIAVLLSGLLVFISIWVLAWLPTDVWWPLMLTVVTLAGLNFLYASLLRREWRVPLLLQVQAYADLVILVVLLHFSGGIENPLSLMLLFHVIIGGLVLSRRQAYAIALAAIALFALLAWAEWADVVAHYTLRLFPHEGDGVHFRHPAHHSVYVLSLVVIQGVVFLLVAYFVTTLVERMRDARRQIEKMNEQALAERQLLERSLETTGSALRVLNRDLQPAWANRRWTEWFGCTPEQAREGLSRLNQGNAPASQTLSDRQIRETEVVCAQVDCASGPGMRGSSTRVFRVITAPLLDDKGAITQIVELSREITHEKQMQDQMIWAGKLAAVGELAGQVAHEVNNPIAIISAKARLLLSDHPGEMSPKVQQELGKITDTADRIARIAQGLLSYCRPASGARALLDARGPVRKALAMIEPRAQKAGVRVETQLDDVPPLVLASAGELEQVFLNLLLNALDAMPGGGTLHVSAPAGQTLRDGSPAAALSVQDTGAGIPEEIRAKIFEPFFSTKQVGHGTGLGLSICQGLVRSHGGEIEVESEPGRGARFIVKLPSAPAGMPGKEPRG